MQINGSTQLIGFFGSTYKTSKMYAMYNAAIKALGLNCIYIPFCVVDLQKAVEGVRNLGVAAIGVTIPYKVEIIKYLDELDSNAARIGAVNVVINRDGRLLGCNTDGEGAIQALKEKVPVTGRDVCVLGAGGAARAIAFALCDEGCNVTILNRTERAAQDLAQDIGENARAGGFAMLPEVLGDDTIIINTTPVGMSGSGQERLSLVPANLLKPGMAVMDIVTNPRETTLIADAVGKGCAVVYGYRMLLWQGVNKFELYTGVKPPVAIMEQAMEDSAKAG
ncbi:MAG: shikimate dehydrogenase [Chloroflexales bacterium]|nr:shikimate dehydrogenase [Chloroflexales bacterium]